MTLRNILNGQIDEFLYLEGLVLKRRYIDENGEVKEQNLIYDDIVGLPHVLLELDERGKATKRYVLSDRVDEIMWVKVFKEEEDDNKDLKQRLYYHTDHLGTVMFLADDRGKKAAEYEYSPYGEILIAQGERAKHNFYTFTGREYLERLGMYDYRARIYDPRVGRFIEVDQIRER